MEIIIDIDSNYTKDLRLIYELIENEKKKLLNIISKNKK